MEHACDSCNAARACALGLLELLGCCNHSGMAPLGDPEKAALRAWLQEKRQDRKLRAEIVTSLLTYFTARGTGLDDLGTSPPPAATPEDLEDWLQDWAEYAKSSGLTDSADVRAVQMWVKRSGRAEDAGTRSGNAAAVADALTKRGLVLDRDAEHTIANALLKANQGARAAQCRDVAVVWILYTGQSPGEDDRAWFAERRNEAAMRGSSDGMDPRVDIRKAPSYGEQHRRTTILTLERALRDFTGSGWENYYGEVVQMLQQEGFGEAALVLIALDAYARGQYLNDVKRRLQFLWLYFFEEHKGRGLPTDKCAVCALKMAVPSAVVDARAIEQSKPTVPNDALAAIGMTPAAMQMQQMQMHAAAMGVGGMAPYVGAGASGAHAEMGRWPPSDMSHFYMQGMANALPPGYPTPAQWPQQPGPPQQQWPQQQWPQQQQQRPGTSFSGPVIEEIDPLVDLKCAFCGKNTHSTDKCTFMLKARKDFRAAALAADQAKAAAKGAEANAAAAAKAAADK